MHIRGMTLYLQLSVFRSSLGDCTNGGVSAAHHTLYLVDPQGSPLKREPDPCLVFRAEDRGDGYLALLPIYTPDGMVGPMFGGNLASSLNGPGGDKIYRVHDRFETPEAYRDLSQ